MTTRGISPRAFASVIGQSPQKPLLPRVVSRQAAIRPMLARSIPLHGTDIGLSGWPETFAGVPSQRASAAMMPWGGRP